jgi:Ca2+-binding RTX toxin-like protein
LHTQGWVAAAESAARLSAMRRRVTSLLLLIGLAVASAAPASGAGKTARCHGRAVTIQGTDGADVYQGTKVRSGDVIALGGDDDYVFLQHVSHVTVCGGQGDDDILAGEHAGRHLLLDGEEGRDSLGSAFYGGDRVADFSMTLFGGGAYDSLSGSQQPDLIRSGNGPDLALGNDGRDLIYGKAGRDDIGGGSGADEIFGGRGDDNLHGGGYLIGGPKTNPGDEADGGHGRDYCEARRERSCERRGPVI